jgi:hypothetical protein
MFGPGELKRLVAAQVYVESQQWRMRQIECPLLVFLDPRCDDLVLFG